MDTSSKQQRTHEESEREVEIAKSWKLETEKSEERRRGARKERRKRTRKKVKEEERRRVTNWCDCWCAFYIIVLREQRTCV